MVSAVMIALPAPVPLRTPCGHRRLHDRLERHIEGCRGTTAILKLRRRVPFFSLPGAGLNMNHAKIRLHRCGFPGQNDAILLPYPDAQCGRFAEDQLLQIGRIAGLAKYREQCSQSSLLHGHRPTHHVQRAPLQCQLRGVGQNLGT